MKIDNVAIPIYLISLLFIHIGYLAVFFGVFATLPTLVNYLNVAVQFFLCFFLMIRFHPFRETYNLKPMDIMFIFGSAFILFTNLVLVEIVQFPMVGVYVNQFFQWFGKKTNIPTIQVSIHDNKKVV
jgi:hypothetical protein